MKSQLRYFQEDVAYKLDAIATILMFGFNFPEWLCWVFFCLTIGQLFYAAYFKRKMEQENKKQEQENE